MDVWKLTSFECEQRLKINSTKNSLVDKQCQIMCELLHLILYSINRPIRMMFKAHVWGNNPQPFMDLLLKQTFTHPICPLYPLPVPHLVVKSDDPVCQSVPAPTGPLIVMSSVPQSAGI